MAYFQTKNPDLGELEGLAMEDIGVLFYGHLV
jgi:hypothetical protein